MQVDEQTMSRYFRNISAGALDRSRFGVHESYISWDVSSETEGRSWCRLGLCQTLIPHSTVTALGNSVTFASGSTKTMKVLLCLASSRHDSKQSFPIASLRQQCIIIPQKMKWKHLIIVIFAVMQPHHVAHHLFVRFKKFSYGPPAATLASDCVA